MKKKKISFLSLTLFIVVLVFVFLNRLGNAPQYSESVKNVPAFSNKPYVIIHDNLPEFTDGDLTQKAYEFYSELDHLGRCGYAMACLGKELMPTEDRESISQVKPSGWKQAQYDIIDGENLYNRCHLIGFQLTGENANERNLITGTRYMNVEGMLPFENMIADYIKETGNHVLYRVTPIYDGNNLVAKGVQLEAKSVEDDGEGICFHVYVYNNQPGVEIDYSDGSSRLLGDIPAITEGQTLQGDITYILNTSSKKFHANSCSQGQGISEDNRDTYTGDRQRLIENGYVPAGCCKP